MADQTTRKVKVRFTEQQLVFLEKVRAEGTFGGKMDEVLLAIFREQIKTMIPPARS